MGNLNLEVLWLVTKVFSTKFRGRTHFGGAIGSTSEQSAEVFSCEILILVRVRVGVREFLPILQKFSTTKVSQITHCKNKCVILAKYFATAMCVTILHYTNCCKRIHAVGDDILYLPPTKCFTSI